MDDIVKRFQEACRNGNNTAYIEDAGCGMKNVWLNDLTLVQCYPDNECHNVWVLLYNEDGDHYDTLISEYTESEQEELFRQYCNKVGFSEADHMYKKTVSEYEAVEREIKHFCWQNGLTHEVSRGWREIDFVMEFHGEAIDTKTLENPTCICTERHIVVFLPQIGENPDYDGRLHYSNVVDRLTNIATPNYIIGAKDGIVKAVMYCVWG